MRDEFAIRALCLVLTHRCNLRCRYCFEQGYEERCGDLSVEDALSALELLEGEEWSIAFFGSLSSRAMSAASASAFWSSGIIPSSRST